MGAACDDRWGVLKSADTDGSIVGGVNNDGGSAGIPGGLLVNYEPIIGLPLTTADGLLNTGTPPPSVISVGTAPTIFNMPGGNYYSNDNFAWAVLGGIEGPTPDNKILIGQFTTDGTLSFCLNLWVKIPDSLVCSDPNCHDILEFYAAIVPSDTLGGGYATQNRFSHPTLCFVSAQADCLGVPGGPALPGTPCDDGNNDTTNDQYDAGCDCVGEDCLGVLGGSALPGSPCDDGDSTTYNDTWQIGCNCTGIVGVNEISGGSPVVTSWPNPVGDLLYINVAHAAGAVIHIELNDALGRTVLERRIDRVNNNWYGNLDLSSFVRGVYFLKVRAGSVAHITRITKQ
jgi:hypothetical protein